MGDLNKIEIEPEEIEFGGQTFEVKPLPWEYGQKFIQASSGRNMQAIQNIMEEMIVKTLELDNPDADYSKEDLHDLEGGFAFFMAMWDKIQKVNQLDFSEEDEDLAERALQGMTSQQ